MFPDISGNSGIGSNLSSPLQMFPVLNSLLQANPFLNLINDLSKSDHKQQDTQHDIR